MDTNRQNLFTSSITLTVEKELGNDIYHTATEDEGD
jgi:hypothetical protein